MAQLTIAALQLAAALAGTPGPGDAYHGGRNELDVRAPRLRESSEVDGVLDEPAWARAAVLTGYSQYRPVDGVPAADGRRFWRRAGACAG